MEIPAPEAEALPQPGGLPHESLHPVLPVERVGAFVEILLCSGFPSQLLLALVLRGFGMTMMTPDGRLSPPFVFTLSLLDAAIVVGLVFFFLRAHRQRARDVLFAHRNAVREVLVGFAIIPLAFLVVVAVLAVILLLAPQLRNVPHNPLSDMLLNRNDALIFAVVVTVAGGIREEFQRGFILHRFGRYLGGAPLGIVVYGVVFGLGHIDQGIDVSIATGVLGMLWGLVYLARRSILAPMVSHAGFNLAQLAKWAIA